MAKISNNQYGICMKPLFYTVNNHLTRRQKKGLKDISSSSEVKKMSKMGQIRMKKLIEYLLKPKSRSLTDEEIEKFQNLYK